MAKVFRDITGQRFGRLVAIDWERPDKAQTVWRCRCDCGAEARVRLAALSRGLTRSCGCLQREGNAKRTVERNVQTQDLTGMRFGLLTVLARAASRDSRGQWHCLCDCGRNSLVRTSYLKTGYTRSCGCLRGKVRAEGTAA